MDGLLHGWPLVVANVLVYGWVYWIAYWFVHGTKGRERVVTGGWAFAMVMSPLKRLLPSLAAVFAPLEVLGLTVALTAAVSLLLYPVPVTAPEAPQFKA